MTLTNKPAFKKWISLLAGLGFLVFILYFLFFTDLNQVAVVIEGVSVPIYLLSFVCVICNSLFNALTWKATTDAVEIKTTFRRIFNLSWVGAFVDCLIPGGLAGDLFMTYLLSKDKDVDGAKALASIIIKDVLELVIVLGSVIIGLIFLVINYSVNSFLLIVIGLTMIFLALPLILIVYLSTNVSATKRLLRILVRAMSKIRSKPFDTANLESKITEFHDGIMSMKKKPRAMVKPIVFQSVTWVFEILALFFVFVALGAQTGVDKIVITNTVVSNIRGQGVALAGFSQIVSSQLYGILGINLSLAQASSLLAGFANFWFRLVVAFVFFQMYGIGTIAEKIANRAFKKKTKKDKKDFKEQTESNRKDFEEKTEGDRKVFEKIRDNKETDYQTQRDSNRRDFEEKTDSNKSDRIEQRDIHRKDFEEKTEGDRKVFEKIRDNKETDYQTQRDSNRRDFEEKTDSNKSDRIEQRDIHRKDFEEKTEGDRKVFEKIRDNKETDYQTQRDSNRRDFEEKTDTERKDFEKLRDDNKSNYEDQRDKDKKVFEEKTETDKSDRIEQRDIHRKDFEEKTEGDKKDFEKLSDTNAGDYKEQKNIAQKDFEEKTDSDKSEYKEQKDTDKRHFKEKMDKDKKDFQDQKDTQNKNDSEK